MEKLSDRLTDVEYAKKGLALWFNNQPTESEEFFKLRMDSTPIFAAYSYVVCMVRLLNAQIKFNLLSLVLLSMHETNLIPTKNYIQFKLTSN